MESNFIEQLAKIAGIAGVIIGVLLILYRELIRKVVFPMLTKKQAYYTIIIFMILIWSLSAFSIVQYFMKGDPNDTEGITVIVHGENGKNDLVLPNRGKVKLIYADASIVETLNDKGEATFKQIPKKFFLPESTAEIVFFDPQGEPYEAIKPDSLYQLKEGKYLSLIVKLKGLDQLYGITRDFKTQKPISDVKVWVVGASIFSTADGEYKLNIPKVYQRKFQTVRASKAGYEFFEMRNVPIQINTEFLIQMKRSNK